MLIAMVPYETLLTCFTSIFKSRKAVVTAAISLVRLVPSTETTVQSALLLLSMSMELLPLTLRASSATLQTCSWPCEDLLSVAPARGLAGPLAQQRGGNALFSGARCRHLLVCIRPARHRGRQRPRKCSLITILAGFDTLFKRGAC